MPSDDYFDVRRSTFDVRRSPKMKWKRERAARA
jgi:hypothetical protein